MLLCGLINSFARIVAVFLVYVMLGVLFSAPISSTRLPGTVSEFLFPEALAQGLDPGAVSKYQEGVSAMRSGDYAEAKRLFREALAIDSRDRSARVGMFTTEYYPNAKLRQAEAKSPSQTGVAKTVRSAPPKPAAQTVTKPVSAAAQPGAGTQRQPVSPAPPRAVSKTPEREKPAETEKPKREFLTHRVYAGETWGSIAKWYTGDAGEGRGLASVNPRVRKLKAGILVKIPMDLAVAHRRQAGHSTAPREEPPPKVVTSREEVKATPKAPAAREAKAAPKAPESALAKPAKPARKKIEGLQGVIGPR